MAPPPRRAPAAVVVGLDSITGLQTARVLASRGVPVVGLARQTRHPACSTRACRRVVYADTWTDELIASLLALGPSFDEPPVLFPCSDSSVLLLSQHREALAPGYRIVHPAPGVLEVLLDKGRFHELAREKSWPLAPTHVLRERADALLAAEVLRFPCVVKPAVKTLAWQAHTPAKVFRVTSRDELLACFDRCSRWTERLIAQEWIDGPDTSHFTCNAYFDADSRPVLTFVSQKLRQWPLEGGVACLSQECRNDEVLDETVRVFRDVGHRGLAYLEMKRDGRTGEHFIIEPNVGRPTGRSAAADAAGVELLFTQYCDAVGWPRPAARRQQYTPAKWVYFRRDLQAAVAQWRRGTLTLSGWAGSLRGCRADAMFSWRDLRPFVADVAVALRKALEQSPLRRWRRRSRGHEPEASSLAATPAPSPRVTVSSDRRAIEYDLHGIVGLRLIDPSPADAEAVARQLGPLQAPLSREPDIRFRYVDRLPLDGLRWVEYGRTGYTDAGLYVLESGKTPVGMRIPFERLGEPCELVCQRGLGSAPLLLPLLNLIACARGYVPLHAAACVWKGRTVLLPAWAHGGKTTALVALMAEGAEFVADEWVWLARDGTRVHGIPGAVALRARQVRHLAAHGTEVPVAARLLGKIAPGGARRHRSWDGRSGRGIASRLRRHAARALQHDFEVRLDPVRAFGVGAWGRASSPDTVFLMMRHERQAVEVTPIDVRRLAARMAASTEHEWLPLLAPYLAHCFAFPERRNALLSGGPMLPVAAFVRALAGTDAYVVRHHDASDLLELSHALASTISAASDRPSRSGQAYARNAAGTLDAVSSRAGV